MCVYVLAELENTYRESITSLLKSKTLSTLSPPVAFSRSGLNLSWNLPRFEQEFLPHLPITVDMQLQPKCLNSNHFNVVHMVSVESGVCVLVKLENIYIQGKHQLCC